MDCDNLIENICEFYNLKEEVQCNLTFSFQTHTSTGRTSTPERIQEGKLLENCIYIDDTGGRHPLFLDQIKLEKKVPPGTLVHHEVSCNTRFMLSTVNEIGRSIRKAYHSVPKNCPIYLVIDNTGRHSTIKAKATFENRLRDH